jgi:hypothetical protein
MLKRLIEWNETLLHKMLRIPHHDHAEPGAPLSTILRSHPLVPAHHRHLSPVQHPDIRSAVPRSFQEQLERERRREPRVLTGWQRRIGALFDRHIAN